MAELEQPEVLWPQIDPLEAEQTFEPEFRTCRDLLALAWARKPAHVGGEGFKALLLAIFARSTLTYRANMHLCRGGYGEQADMLNRSLFEVMAAGIGCRCTARRRSNASRSTTSTVVCSGIA